MDWEAFNLSLRLALYTVALLIPIGIAAARVLAYRRFPGRNVLQAVLALPLVLPPTVLGFYLLTALGRRGAIGAFCEDLFGVPLVFSFTGLLLASIIFNVPFAIQPIQRALEAVPDSIREAAWCSGLSRWRTFLNIELPLIWPGILSATVLAFAHTLGEFGVVLMLGGNIEGETRTISIAIYDRVQALDNASAGLMSAVLLALSFTAIATIYMLNERFDRKRAW